MISHSRAEGNQRAIARARRRKIKADEHGGGSEAPSIKSTTSGSTLSQDLGQAQAVWPCRDLSLLMATALRACDRATRWIEDGEPQELSRSVISTRAHEVVAGAVPLLPMPGICRRVFRFLCIADLCNGYRIAVPAYDAQEIL